MRDTATRIEAFLYRLLSVSDYVTSSKFTNFDAIFTLKNRLDYTTKSEPFSSARTDFARSARLVVLYSVARFGSVHGREYAPARPAALSSIRIYFAGGFDN